MWQRPFHSHKFCDRVIYRYIARLQLTRAVDWERGMQRQGKAHQDFCFTLMITACIYEYILKFKIHTSNQCGVCYGQLNKVIKKYIHSGL